MAKILLTIIILLTLAFIVVAMYCACVLAGRSDEQANIENNEGANDLLNKKICPRCKTGKYTYDLDPKSDACPYIGCWRRNKCSFYKPLEKMPKKSVLSDFKDKRIVPPRKNKALFGLKMALMHISCIDGRLYGKQVKEVLSLLLLPVFLLMTILKISHEFLYF